MAERYEDSERGRRSGERGQEHDRGEWGRDDPYNRGRAGRGEFNQGNQWSQGNQGEERYGRNDWDRERRSSGGDFGNRGGEFSGRSEFGGRGEYGGGRSEFGGRGEYGGGRGEYGGRTEYGGGRGDFGNRGFEGEQDWRQGSEWNRERSGNERSFGMGSRGSGGGSRSGDFGNSGMYGGGYSGYTGYAGGGGSESYSGGAGMYGQQQGQQQGRFSGRGPKGYQRSDDRIREDVCERLTHHPEIDAGEIEVNVKDGEVTLTGTVEERQAKRMAEDVAENISGVKDVRNQIQVRHGQMAGVQQGRSEQGTERSGTENKQTTGQKR